jgi:tetratricopeptide (TPR) repeat protein
MDFHLNQQFDDALRNWQTVALSPNASQSLKSLAWYWIGYEQNNLNRFNEAEQSFENAAQHSQGIGGNRRFELQRILLETRFFNKERYRAESLVVPFEQLLVSIDKESPSDERDARRIKILVTLANVTYRSGKDAIMAADGHETAKTRFARARELYSQAAPKDKWAQFGLAEILNLSDVDADRREALAIFKRVRQDAIDESVRREEPRTKVLARTTELVCCLRVPEFKQEVSAIRSLVLQELGRVDERLTVYSQIQRRNVTKTAFQDDLEDLISREVQGGQRSQSA